MKKTHLQVKQLAIVENKEEKSEAEDTKPQESDSPAVNGDIQTSEEKISEGQQAWQDKKLGREEKIKIAGSSINIEIKNFNKYKTYKSI